MIWFGLKMLGLGKWLREAATALLDLIRRYPLQAALVVLLALLAWTWHSKSRAIGQRDAAIAGRVADRKAYTAAQAEAERLQAETDHVAIDRQLAFNAQQERNHAILEQTRRSAVADYAASHAVRVCRQAVGGAPGGTVATAVSGDSGQPAGVATVPDMVAVTGPDFDNLTAGAVQNAERGQFLQWLIDSGFAVRGD